jgi:hypothetical protein
MADEAGSVIRIAFMERLDPAEYARAVHGCWGVLVAAGHAKTATIHSDTSATDEKLDSVLADVIEHSPWGW